MSLCASRYLPFRGSLLLGTWLVHSLAHELAPCNCDRIFIFRVEVRRPSKQSKQGVLYRIRVSRPGTNEILLGSQEAHQQRALRDSTVGGHLTIAECCYNLTTKKLCVELQPLRVGHGATASDAPHRCDRRGLSQQPTLPAAGTELAGASSSSLVMIAHSTKELYKRHCLALFAHLIENLESV
ncbi:hypothetical protein QVD17_24848 [Tagetes erecta]|uniref:Secreted protein n=1 Tax=Tagetes erecta TaxID=13708 RepID=A0AAD8NUR6_TARER|nr:hypothetical protein QVD17_24848 [Tagetes erecta]